MPEHHYIIEYHRIGRYVKVSAIDPITYTEVSITGDPKISKHMLSKIAVRKLQQRLEKQTPSS